MNHLSILIDEAVEALRLVDKIHTDIFLLTAGQPLMCRGVAIDHTEMNKAAYMAGSVLRKIEALNGR